MSLAQRIGERAIEQEREQRATDFAHCARYLMMSKGSFFAAALEARQRRALPRIIECLEKAATAAGSTTGWGSSLAPYSLLSDAFLASLRNVGCFDQMLPFAKQVPLRTQISVVTLGATAASVGEGQAKIISKLTLAAAQLDPIKAVAILIASDELLKASGPLAANLFAAELAGAVAAETDRSFLNEITTGAPSIPSSGSTLDAVLTDIGNALGALTLGSQSKVFLVIDSGTAKRWALLHSGASVPAFPAMTINGGSIAGCSVVVSDGLSATLIAFDASQFAANGGDIELDGSNQAAIQMDSAPNSPPSAASTITSLWGHDLTGLRATRYFGVERLGANGVSKVTGIANSPA